MANFTRELRKIPKNEFDIADIANYKKPVSLYLRVNAKEIDILKPLVNILSLVILGKLLALWVQVIYHLEQVIVI